MVLAKSHWYIQAVCCVHMHSQSCPTLSDSKDYSLPGASVHEIFQARILEQVATSFCRDLPDPGIEPMYLVSPVLTGGFFTIWVTGEAPVYSLSSVQSSVMSDSLRPHGLQYADFPVHYHLPEPIQLVSIALVMPSSHLILCRPLLLPPSVFPSIRVFSSELILRIR